MTLCNDEQCYKAIEHEAEPCRLERLGRGQYLHERQHRGDPHEPRHEPEADLAAAIAIVDRYDRERVQLQNDLAALAMQEAAQLGNEATAAFHAGAHVAYAAAAKMCERMALRAGEG